MPPLFDGACHSITIPLAVLDPDFTEGTAGAVGDVAQYNDTGT
jgi:hypothetical protein